VLANSAANDTTYGGVHGALLLSNIQSGRYKRFHGFITYDDTASAYVVNMRAGRWNNTGTIDGLRFLFSSGNIAGGRVSLLGLRA
jgi:hypothetical protein